MESARLPELRRWCRGSRETKAAGACKLQCLRGESCTERGLRPTSVPSTSQQSPWETPPQARERTIQRNGGSVPGAHTRSRLCLFPPASLQNLRMRGALQGKQTRTTPQIRTVQGQPTNPKTRPGRVMLHPRTKLKNTRRNTRHPVTNADKSTLSSIQ